MNRATILQRILDRKQEELAERQSRAPLVEVRRAAEQASAVRGFEAALRSQVEAGRSGVIAEVKKASPSKGVIRADFDPVAIARSYAAGGACCLSVLTDRDFFQGAEEYLLAAREAVSLPIIRKDFMVAPYQIYESRAIGADCILLIVAALGREQLFELAEITLALGMDLLIEVHDEAELALALEMERGLIGINNRNLHTFETSLDTTFRLLPQIPAERLVVTESGIHSRDHVEAMWQHEVFAFLVGESLMRQPDPGTALEQLFF